MADQDHIYIFHHVPKCGGTSMAKAFEEMFSHVVYDHRPAWDTGEAFDEYVRNPVDLDRLEPDTIVCGHYARDRFRLQERYPTVWTDPRIRVITFVRQPLATQLSLMRYELKHEQLDEDEDFAQLLLNRVNYMSGVLHCRENMQSVLDRYWFRGITEDSQACIDALADELGKPRVTLDRVNRTEPRDLGISDEVVRQFHARNGLDAELYRRSVRHWATYQMQRSVIELEQPIELAVSQPAG